MGVMGHYMCNGIMWMVQRCYDFSKPQHLHHRQQQAASISLFQHKLINECKKERKHMNGCCATTAVQPTGWYSQHSLQRQEDRVSTQKIGWLIEQLCAAVEQPARSLMIGFCQISRGELALAAAYIHSCLMFPWMMDLWGRYLYCRHSRIFLLCSLMPCSSESACTPWLHSLLQVTLLMSAEC